MAQTGILERNGGGGPLAIREFDPRRGDAVPSQLDYLPSVLSPVMSRNAFVRLLETGLYLCCFAAGGPFYDGGPESDGADGGPFCDVVSLVNVGCVVSIRERGPSLPSFDCG